MKQDILKASHDYRILSTILTRAGGEDGKDPHKDTQTFYLDSRAERAFTFSLWAKTDKDIKTEVKIAWDCFASKTSKTDFDREIKEGKDKLPINAAFRILKNQNDSSLNIRYQEECRIDNKKRSRRRTWDWHDKNDQNIKNIISHKGWAFCFHLEHQGRDGSGEKGCDGPRYLKQEGWRRR